MTNSEKFRSKKHAQRHKPRRPDITSFRSINPVPSISYSLKETVSIKQLKTFRKRENGVYKLKTRQKRNNLQSIFSSTGKFGWNTFKARTKSPKSMTPLFLTSNRSNIYKVNFIQVNCIDNIEPQHIICNIANENSWQGDVYPISEKIFLPCVFEQCKLELFLRIYEYKLLIVSVASEYSTQWHRDDSSLWYI